MYYGTSKNTMELYAKRFDTCEPVRILLSCGRISAVEAIENAEQLSSGRLPWVAPGLIDAQMNGYAGQEFSSDSLTVEKVAKIGAQMDAFCVTRTYPTVTTNSLDSMSHSLRTIVSACQESATVARQFPGIHVEGPFISPHDGPRGAHPAEHVRRPDWDVFQRLQESAAGMIRILTISPEYEGVSDFIRRVADSGVVVSIGHTAATSDQIHAAADAGARMCTHLGNGSHAMIPRHDNYVWAQLADDRLTAGIIADGHHLPPDVVKTFIRAKTVQRTVLVSDMSGLAGLPPGRYAGDLCELEILPSGKMVVAGQTENLAGASLPLGTCLANVTRFAGVTLREAVEMAVTNPAKLLGADVPDGFLNVGDPVELAVFDLVETAEEASGLRFEPRATIVGEDVVFGRIPENKP